MTRKLMMAALALAWATNVTAAGGRIDVERRGGYGLHPCGIDPNKTGKIVTS